MAKTQRRYRIVAVEQGKIVAPKTKKGGWVSVRKGEDELDLCSADWLVDNWSCSQTYKHRYERLVEDSTSAGVDLVPSGKIKGADVEITKSGRSLVRLRP